MTFWMTWTQFNSLYQGSIDNSEKAALPAKRINNIIELMTYEIYVYIQRGLFERHKIVFALMLATKILASVGMVPLSLSPQRFEYFESW